MVARGFYLPLLLLLLPLAALASAREDLFKPGTDVLLVTEEDFEVRGMADRGAVGGVLGMRPRCCWSTTHRQSMNKLEWLGH